jgi:hypothetical protein
VPFSFLAYTQVIFHPGTKAMLRINIHVNWGCVKDDLALISAFSNTIPKEDIQESWEDKMP